MPGGTRVRGSDVFAAIGDPTRRQVLNKLSKEDLPAGEIAAHFRISRPAISRKRGREHVYKLRSEPLQEVYEWVEHYQQFWTRKVAGLGEYLDRISRGGK